MAKRAKVDLTVSGTKPKKRRKVTKKQPGWVDIGLEAGALIFGSGGAGALHGGIAEKWGDDAAGWVRLGMIGSGLVAFLATYKNKKKYVILHETGKALVVGGATLEGDDWGRRLVRAWEKREAEQAASKDKERDEAIVAALQGKITELQAMVIAEKKKGEEREQTLREALNEELNGKSHPAEQVETVSASA